MKFIQLNWQLGSLVLMLALVTGCTSPTDMSPTTEESKDHASPSKQAEETMTITVSDEKGATLFAEKGVFLMEVMKEQFDIGEEKYWIYSVNDELAMVGVAVYELKVGDDIVFNLKEWV